MKVYLQITSLEPYFTSEDLAARPTFFDKNTILSKTILFL